MADNKFMGTFDSETEVLRKIEEMKAQGASESDMYVMANDKDQISMVRGRTDVDYKSSEGNWMDKFMGFLSGNDSVREAFSGMGVDDEEADRYYREVQNGKILLFVDREYGANYKGDAPYDNDAYSDPSTTKGATGVAGASSATGAAGYRGSTDSDRKDYAGSAGVDKNRHPDTGAVAKDGLTVDTNEQNDIAYNTEHNTFGRDETAGVGKDSGTGFGLGTETTGENVRDTEHTKDQFAESDRGAVNSRTGTEEEKLRLHEERLNVDKEKVQTGEVNVGKHVVEEEQSIEVPVEREEVYVERRPVDEEVTTDKKSGLSGEAYQKGDDIHIPVTEERVEVSKKDVVGEEIVVGKRKVEDTETVKETVRHEEADIDEDTNNLRNKNKGKTDLDNPGRDDLNRKDRDRF